MQDFAFAFLSILFEGAPFILLGTLLSGFIDVYLPSGTIERFLPRNKYAAVLVSGFLGLVLPVCECAVVPVIRRLVKKGLPVSCGLTVARIPFPSTNPYDIRVCLINGDCSDGVRVFLVEQGFPFYTTGG